MRKGFAQEKLRNLELGHIKAGLRIFLFVLHVPADRSAYTADRTKGGRDGYRRINERKTKPNQTRTDIA